MAIKNQEAWDKWVEANPDPYGKCCVDVARQVMLELDKNEPFDCHKIICDADDAIKAGGITGFMAGAVAQMVIQCHERGDEFKKQWNASYGVPDTEGVVNPAILTVGEKE